MAKSNKSSSELPGMPDKDTGAKLADELWRLRNDIREIRKKAAEKEDELIKVLEATGRMKLKLESAIFEIEMKQAKSRIRIKPMGGKPLEQV